MSEKLTAAQAIFGEHMAAIAQVFLPGARVTLLVRNPDGEEASGARGLMMTSNTLDNVAETIPFMGAGSTGIATIRAGKHFAGIEEDPGYFATAVRRIKAAVAQHQQEAA